MGMIATVMQRHAPGKHEGMRVRAGMPSLIFQQVRALQTDCQTLQSERQGVRQALKTEAERASQLEKQCQQLRDKAGHFLGVALSAVLCMTSGPEL